MKKVIIATLFLSLGINVKTFAKLCFHGQTTVKDNGTPNPNGPMTYGTVSETEDHTSLLCELPGSKSCLWADGTVPHGVGIVVGTTVYTINQVLETARMQAGNGVLTGYVTGDNETGYYSWQKVGPDLIVTIEICY